MAFSQVPANRTVDVPVLEKWCGPSQPCVLRVPPPPNSCMFITASCLSLPRWKMGHATGAEVFWDQSVKTFGFYTYKDHSKSCFLGHIEEEITAKHLFIFLLWMPNLYKITGQKSSCIWAPMLSQWLMSPCVYQSAGKQEGKVLLLSQSCSFNSFSTARHV